jgi:hypothetical protein
MQADRGELIEASARVVERSHWMLREGDELTPINCIEQGAAIWLLEGDVQRRRLQWQFDVNTAPDPIPTYFEADPMKSFFARGVEWIEMKIHDLE